MKKTQIKDSIRNIRKQIVSYISIALVIALGVGIFLACLFGSQAVSERIDEKYREMNYRDLEIRSPSGVSEDDLDLVKALPFVKEAEGFFSLDMIMNVGIFSSDVHVISATEHMDQPELIEGVLPANDNECAIVPEVAEKYGLAVGNYIRLEPIKKSQDYLKNISYKITGIIRHPDDLRANTQTTFIVLIAKDAVDTERLGVPYIGMLLRTDANRFLTFSDQYKKESLMQADELERIGKPRVAIRVKQLAEEYRDAEGKLNKFREKLYEAENKIRDGKKQLKKARKQLVSGRQEIKDGKKQLKEGKKELDAGAQELAAARAQLDAGWAQLQAGANELAAGRARLDKEESNIESFVSDLNQAIAKGWAELKLKGTPPQLPSVREFTNNYTLYSGQVVDKIISLFDLSGKTLEEIQKLKNEYWGELSPYFSEYDQLPAGEAQYAAGKAQYDAGLWEWQNGNAQYQQGLALYNQKLAEYEAGKGKLEEGIRTYKENLQKYKDGRKTLKEGGEKLAGGRKKFMKFFRKLDAARMTIESLDEANWVVLDRTLNMTWAEIDSIRITFISIGVTFALMFVLMGVLVCYATIGKIIDEQRKLVGTMKAVGFHKREILGKYMIFGLSAAIMGVIAGILICLLIMEPIMLRSMETMYLAGRIPMVFRANLVILAVVIELSIAAFAVWVACSRLLKQPAKNLMAGADPSNFFQKSAEKSGRSLYSSLLFRNMLSDWKRVLITVVSIAGSCLLLVVGASIKDSYVEILNHQFKDIMHFSALVRINPEEEYRIDTDMSAFASDYGLKAAPARLLPSVMDTGSGNEAVQMISIDPEVVSDFFHFTDAKTGKNIEFPKEGLLIFDGLASAHHLKVGDTVSLMDEFGSFFEIPISGIYNNYAGRFVFMSYHNEPLYFDILQTDNMFFLSDIPESGKEEVQEEVERISGVTSYTALSDLSEQYEQTSNLMNIVIIVCTVMAAIMAAVVLLNLLRIQINQKRLELTVMRINGFSTRETINYILRENILTTCLGVILGLVAGYFASRLTLDAMTRVDLKMFDGFMWLPMVFAAILTVGFAAIMNFLALRKIRYLKLSDVTK